MKKKASASFLKKRTKKLLRLDPAAETATGPDSQKFFGSFFQKRTSCLLFVIL
jgi:hypothetical protein